MNGADEPRQEGGTAEDLGGDPACWLHQVCEACGAFIDHGDDHACPARPKWGDGDNASQLTDSVEPKSTGPASA